MGFSILASGISASRPLGETDTGLGWLCSAAATGIASLDMPAQLCKSFDCKFETAYGLLLLCFSVVLIETIGGLRS
jgi:hypothetical protein